ncbi:MAG: hypothetical protein N3J91_12745 [Verrucomicrobiae bacterium]|nr:hypothetical protein [Verrucomicrobiae bacterium]
MKAKKAERGIVSLGLPCGAKRGFLFEEAEQTRLQGQPGVCVTLDPLSIRLL